MHSIWNSCFVNIKILKLPKKLKSAWIESSLAWFISMASLIFSGVRIITLVNAILLRSLLSIRQKQQGRLEVDGRYVAVNVAASAKSASMTDIFGVNACISFLTTKCISVWFNIGDSRIWRHLWKTCLCNLQKIPEFFMVLSFAFNFGK